MKKQHMRRLLALVLSVLTVLSTVHIAVTAEETTPEPAVFEKLTASPEDGAKVVIHYPADNKALTALVLSKAGVGMPLTVSAPK